MTSTLRDGRGCLDRSNFADIQVINVGQGGGRVFKNPIILRTDIGSQKTSSCYNEEFKKRITTCLISLYVHIPTNVLLACRYMKDKCHSNS